MMREVWVKVVVVKKNTGKRAKKKSVSEKPHKWENQKNTMGVAGECRVYKRSRWRDLHVGDVRGAVWVSIDGIWRCHPRLVGDLTS